MVVRRTRAEFIGQGQSLWEFDHSPSNIGQSLNHLSVQQDGDALLHDDGGCQMGLMKTAEDPMPATSEHRNFRLNL